MRPAIYSGGLRMFDGVCALVAVDDGTVDPYPYVEIQTSAGQILLPVNQYTPVEFDRLTITNITGNGTNPRVMVYQY